MSETDVSTSSAVAAASIGASEISGARVVDGRRTSLYADLDEMKSSKRIQSTTDETSIEGRRSSLYSDLESLRQSMNTVRTSLSSSAGENDIDGRRKSLYADLENL